MIKTRSIVFYMPNLAGGGIERVTLLMAPYFLEQGYRVTFLVQTADGDLIENVPLGVRFISLEVSRTLRALFPLVRFLRREKPDIFVTSYGHNNVVALLAKLLAFAGTPVVVTQHNALSAETVNSGGAEFSKALPFLYKLFLRFADGIVAVSSGVADEMATLAKVRRNRISVIFNPVIPATFDADIQAPCGHPWFEAGAPPVIVGVGRLVEVKDFSTLLAAFAKLVKKKDARLILLGEGPLRETLEAQAQILGIKNKVGLIGFVPNPLPFITRAVALALSSTHEGFGNVLVEAMACGTPVVSTDCPYGPREILDKGRYGKLVPVGDSDAMAKALLATIDAPRDTEALKIRGREFTVERAVRGYTALFERILSR
ncbi:MAG: glycosyltransferase [Alphaproteobacteria bacterium]|nr:glycosyltransferase [Alphaproteobacteria bacterium]